METELHGSRCSQRNLIVSAAAQKIRRAQKKSQPKEKVDYDLMKKPVIAGIQKIRRQRRLTDWFERDIDLNVKIQ